MFDKKANLCSKKVGKYIDKHVFWCYYIYRTNVREHIFDRVGGNEMKKYLVMFFVFVMVLSCFFGKTLVMANAEENSVVYDRYYTNIEVQNGDTLWSIAKTYNKNSGMEIREYIREVKQMNRMISDDIEAGESLTIVYFAK